MAETPAITDRNLEATTNISLKREPACFAFLSARSVAPPMPIDSINLDLASAAPPIDLFSERAPIYTRPRFLPGTQMRRVTLDEAIVCEGSRIDEAQIEHSIIGIRSIIGHGVRLAHTVMMGADFYESKENHHATSEIIPVGIGPGSTIERAIIDKNARIGDNVVIRNQDNVERFDGPGYFVRDGIVIIPKNGVIPAGTVI